MPARTNDFQELVSLIERTLAPKGAKITDSADVEVFGLATTREVDVLIEGPYGPYTMKVAVEAKDEGRKLDIGTFDALCQKYRGECRVLVDKFVIVSRNGFTKGAEEKAARLDVELLTLDEAKEKDWSKTGPGTCSFQKPPHVCKIFFLPPIEAPDAKDFWHHAHLLCPHGHDHGPIIQYANCKIFHQLFPSRPNIVKGFQQELARSPQGEAVLIAKPPVEGFTVSYRGQQHQISSIAIHVHAVSQTGTGKHSIFQRQSSRGDSRLLHQIEMSGGGMDLSLIIPDGPTPPPQIGLRVRPSGKKGSEDGRKRRNRRK